MRLGSGIRDPGKTYSGSEIRSRGQKGTGSRIRIRNTGVPYRLIFSPYGTDRKRKYVFKTKMACPSPRPLSNNRHLAEQNPLVSHCTLPLRASYEKSEFQQSRLHYLS
jgi:hypothetical protein